MYLRRRLKKLFDDLRSGKLTLPAASEGSELHSELSLVQFDSNGTPVLSTCGPSLRALARCHHNVGAYFDEDEQRSRSVPTPLPDLNALQKELFSLFEEFYIVATDSTPNRFVLVNEEFADAIHRRGRAFRSWSPRQWEQFEQKLTHITEKLRGFYTHSGGSLFRAAKSLPGQKLVLGGASRFTASSDRAVRQMALYADSILVPDPVLPWIEIERKEERFSFVHIIEQIHHLLPLRPLIDVGGHPLVVFPSWEKSLEAKDITTQDGIEKMMLSVFNGHLKTLFEDTEELTDYLKKEPELFLKNVYRGGLLIPPGGTGAEPLQEVLRIIREHYQKWRSQEYLRLSNRVPEAQLAAAFIQERLAPFFHLEENARELTAQPLMAIRQHWHYFERIQAAHAAQGSADDANLMRALTTIRAVSDERYSWLGNVPIAALAELRSRGENKVFRKRISEEIAFLAGANEGNYDATVAQVAEALRKLLTEHDYQARELEERYQRTYTKQAVLGGVAAGGSWLTAAAKFLPWFPEPTVIVSGLTMGALALAHQYLGEKATQARERRTLRRTLLGHLAAAKETS